MGETTSSKEITGYFSGIAEDRHVFVSSSHDKPMVLLSIRKEGDEFLTSRLHVEAATFYAASLMLEALSVQGKITPFEEGASQEDWAAKVNEYVWGTFREQYKRLMDQRVQLIEDSIKELDAEIAAQEAIDHLTTAE